LEDGFSLAVGGSTLGQTFFAALSPVGFSGKVNGALLKINAI